MTDFQEPIETPPPPPRRGWFARNWLWFIPTVFLGSAILCAGCCGGIFVLGFKAIKSSEPYQMALERSCNDPLVIEQLGEPIEESGWMFNGEITPSDARFDFHIAGPRGKANVHAEGRLINGQWALTRLLVTPEGGQEISLDLSDQSNLDEAPLFQP